MAKQTAWALDTWIPDKIYHQEQEKKKDMMVFLRSSQAIVISLWLSGSKHGFQCLSPLNALNAENHTQGHALRPCGHSGSPLGPPSLSTANKERSIGIQVLRIKSCSSLSLFSWTEKERTRCSSTARSIEQVTPEWRSLAGLNAADEASWSGSGSDRYPSARR